MVSNKSLDENKLIAALLCDVQTSHGDVFSTRALRLTCLQVKKRVHAEGIGFLTKTLPRLGRALDRALAEDTPLNATCYGFAATAGSKLPRFLGELFGRVLNQDGTVLQDPCIKCITVLRQILYLFYKYELPYTTTQEQAVLSDFIKAEEELESNSGDLRAIALDPPNSYCIRNCRYKATCSKTIARRARRYLSVLLRSFDPRDIIPRHGPGAVATKQKLWDKYQWSNVSNRITDYYPFDAYFCASQGHVCDSYNTFSKVDSRDLPARVTLVPKDSRGPRLISSEPVDYQWVQQGLRQALYSLVEHHNITRYNVYFTSQRSNQLGALLGSKYGLYATLDLKEASDRVHLELVRLLFPPHICEALEACRSAATELPDGRILKLSKFAPMGSALCFPIMALTIWAILTAGAPDADTREGILVYGDDVIVPTAYAANAIKLLELFGLKVNYSKSCTKGFFRESCGVDAYKGVDVTPVRLRTVWSSSPSPGPYASWIAYANSMYARGYFAAYDYIVGLLLRIYGAIPDQDMQLACPSLVEVPDQLKRFRTRTNYRFQKRQFRVRVVTSKKVHHVMPGWLMLLRYFTEGSKAITEHKRGLREEQTQGDEPEFAFRVCSYTKRDTSKLVWRWR